MLPSLALNSGLSKLSATPLHSINEYYDLQKLSWQKTIKDSTVHTMLSILAIIKKKKVGN
jgi:hypothetical protein